MAEKCICIPSNSDGTWRLDPSVSERARFPFREVIGAPPAALALAQWKRELFENRVWRIVRVACCSTSQLRVEERTDGGTDRRARQFLLPAQSSRESEMPQKDALRERVDSAAGRISCGEGDDDRGRRKKERCALAQCARDGLEAPHSRQQQLSRKMHASVGADFTVGLSAANAARGEEAAAARPVAFILRALAASGSLCKGKKHEPSPPRSNEGRCFT